MRLAGDVRVGLGVPLVERRGLKTEVAAVVENPQATVQIANEEGTATEVTLYSTNFVADQGYEIPSLRVTILPRVLSIPAGGSAEFEITIAVPQQTPKGYYSGLIQAMGSKYFKAVLSLEVL